MKIDISKSIHEPEGRLESGIILAWSNFFIKFLEHNLLWIVIIFELRFLLN